MCQTMSMLLLGMLLSLFWSPNTKKMCDRIAVKLSLQYCDGILQIYPLWWLNWFSENKNSNAYLPSTIPYSHTIYTIMNAKSIVEHHSLRKYVNTKTHNIAHWVNYLALQVQSLIYSIFSSHPAEKLSYLYPTLHLILGMLILILS